VIREDDLGAPAERAQPLRRDFGGFNLDVNRMGPVAHRQIQNRQLFLDAAVELASILVTAASSDQAAVRESIDKYANGLGALTGIVQIVEAELQEGLAGLGFPLGMLQQGAYIRKA
jgi:hypothetical protein